MPRAKAWASKARVNAVLHYRLSNDLAGSLGRRTPDWLRLVTVDSSDSVALAKIFRTMDVLFHVLDPVTDYLMSFAPQLKLIQKIGVGVDTIDLVAANKREIIVANMPGTNTRAVAEMTLSLILCVLRRVVMLDRSVRVGSGWNLAPESYEGVGEVFGRVVGFIGYGAVPRYLAPILQSLGARIIYSSRTLLPGPVGEARSLNDLLAEADIVSLHVPSTPATEALINQESIARMRRGSILINTARGSLIDEAALTDALNSGHIRGAGIDVLRSEPARSDNPLLSLDNVVVTPHTAWLTPETFHRSLTVAIENCRRLRDGEPLLHQINFTQYSAVSDR